MPPGAATPLLGWSARPLAGGRFRGRSGGTGWRGPNRVARWQSAGPRRRAARRAGSGHRAPRRESPCRPAAGCRPWRGQHAGPGTRTRQRARPRGNDGGYPTGWQRLWSRRWNGSSGIGAAGGSSFLADVSTLATGLRRGSWGRWSGGSGPGSSTGAAHGGCCSGSLGAGTAPTGLATWGWRPKDGRRPGLSLPDAPPATPPSLGMIGRLLAGVGGFLGRKREGHPGPQTLW